MRPHGSCGKRRIDSLPRRRLFYLSFPPCPGPGPLGTGERALAGAEQDHCRGLAPAAPPRRSPAPRRRRGRRTGGEKARVPSRLLASYCARGLSNSPSDCASGPAPEFASRSALPAPDCVPFFSARARRARQPRPQPSPAATVRSPRGATSPSRRGGGGCGEGTLRVTHAHGNLQGMPAAAGEAHSEPGVPRHAPSGGGEAPGTARPISAQSAPHHFPSSPARVGISGSGGEGTHLFQEAEEEVSRPEATQQDLSSASKGSI